MKGRRGLDAHSGARRSLAYLVLACRASNACYVEPCMQGVGFEELWKIDKGLSAACVAGGLVGVGQSAAARERVGCIVCAPRGFYFPNDKKIHPQALALFSRSGTRAPFVAGVVVGASALVGALFLGQAGLWMAQWNLLYDLSEVSPISPIFDQSGRHMVVAGELRRSFRSLALTASFCCLGQALLAVAVGASRERIATRHFALRGGACERLVETSEAIPLM